MRKIAIVALVAFAFVAVAAAPSRSRAGVEEASASVQIKDSEFQPKEIKVKAGTTITWTNNDGASHTVTADDGSFESPTLGKGKTFSRKFEQPGTFPYYCAFHGGMGGDGMSGTVVVTR